MWSGFNGTLWVDWTCSFKGRGADTAGFQLSPRAEAALHQRDSPFVTQREKRGQSAREWRLNVESGKRRLGDRTGMHSHHTVTDKTRSVASVGNGSDSAAFLEFFNFYAFPFSVPAI